MPINTPTPKKNPRWERDELILALDLYLQYRFSPIETKAIKELSEFLNQLGKKLGKRVEGTFRNENGVSMKLMNFRRLDPAYKNTGKVGLARGNKDEEFVWSEFANAPVELAMVVGAIKSALLMPEILTIDEPEVSEALEGKVLTRLHRVRERSPKIARQCKELAITKYGRLCCEACGFDFTETYGQIGAGLIDVHHKRPLYSLAESSVTKASDLALVCCNCHRLIHSSRQWLTIEQVKDAIKATQRGDKRTK